MRSIRWPRKPCHRIKHEVDRMIRITRCGDMAIRNSTLSRGVHLGPPFWGRGGCRESLMVFERAMLVSIVTIALSLTVQPQFAIECLWRSNQHGVGHWVKILGCSLWSRSWFGDLQRANKHLRLTNREIIFKEFQPMWSFTIPQRHVQTDGQTTCRSKWCRLKINWDAASR